MKKIIKTAIAGLALLLAVGCGSGNPVTQPINPLNPTGIGGNGQCGVMNPGQKIGTYIGELGSGRTLVLDVFYANLPNQGIIASGQKQAIVATGTLTMPSFTGLFGMGSMGTTSGIPTTYCVSTTLPNGSQSYGTLTAKQNWNEIEVKLYSMTSTVPVAPTTAGMPVTTTQNTIIVELGKVGMLPTILKNGNRIDGELLITINGLGTAKLMSM